MPFLSLIYHGYFLNTIFHDKKHEDSHLILQIVFFSVFLYSYGLVRVLNKQHLTSRPFGNDPYHCMHILSGKNVPIGMDRVIFLEDLNGIVTVTVKEISQKN